LIPFFAAAETLASLKSTKFPVFSLLTGNFRLSETGSLKTPSSVFNLQRDPRVERIRRAADGAMCQQHARCRPQHRLWRCRRNGTDARFWPRRAELGPVDETGTGGFRASEGTGRISGMLDPATCAGMVLGVPRVTSKPFDHVPRPGIERQIARLIKNLPATRF